MLAFIVGLAAEARLLKPLGARVFIGGGTSKGAAQATHRALSAGATSFVSFGLAGGLSPALQPGAIVIPRAVLVHGRHMLTDRLLTAALGGATADALLASEAVVASIAGKTERRADTHADAVDMESGAVAKAAQKAGLPFAVLRAICDPASRALPPAAAVALDGAGRIGLLRVGLSILLNPGQISSLRALSRDAAAARTALAGRVAKMQSEASLAHWR